MSEFGVMQRPEDEDETARWEAQKERREVTVDTEFGRKCVIEFHGGRDNLWALYISQELIDAAPERLVAALSMAVMAMKSDRFENRDAEISRSFEEPEQ